MTYKKYDEEEYDLENNIVYTKESDWWHIMYQVLIRIKSKEVMEWFAYL